MAHPLDEAHAKLGHARSHLNKLNRVADKFIATHRHRISTERDPQTREVILVARAIDPDEPVPRSVSLIAGDIANNVRAALNYLVWQLAVRQGTTHDQLQFPIIHEEGARTYHKSPADRFADAIPRFHLGECLDPAHIALIESFQPYKGGDNRPLAFLAVVNDLDKHRLLTRAARMAVVTPPVLGGVPIGTIIRIDPAVTMHDGAILVRFVNLRTPADEEVKVRFDPPVYVFVGEAGGLMANTPTFGELIDLTERILRAFSSDLA